MPSLAAGKQGTLLQIGLKGGQKFEAANGGNRTPFQRWKRSGYLADPLPWRKGFPPNRKQPPHSRQRFQVLNEAQEKGEKFVTLSEVAEKGLRPLSLSEQVELERQAEERGADEEKESRSVALSSLAGKRVLSLEKQVELERPEEENAAAAQTEAPEDVASRSSYAEYNLAEQVELEVRERQIGAGQKAGFDLSQVAGNSFWKRTPSLSEQVEAERLAEEQKQRQERELSETSKGGQHDSRDNAESSMVSDDVSQASTSDPSQERIEAKLEKQLQEVLKGQSPPRNLPAGVSSDELQEEVLDSVPESSTSQLPSLHSGASNEKAPLQVSLLQVKSPEEVQALANLRAQVFYKYPDVQQMTAAQKVTARSDLRKMLKANVQEEKGLIDFLHAVRRDEIDVLAVCERSYYDSLLVELPTKEPDPYRDVILQPATLTQIERVEDDLGTFEVEKEMVVIGTFSLYVGTKLSGQNLVGAKPVEVKRQADERGHLFSICVLPTMQRRGLGRMLVEEGKLLAKKVGVKHLYVHVELSNLGAENLYKKLGFVTEQVETEEVARSLTRPRRQLLWCNLEDESRGALHLSSEIA